MSHSQPIDLVNPEDCYPEPRIHSS